MKSRWVDGNRFELLINGEGFYPRVFEAIDRAEKEVIVETFILFDDKVGQALKQALTGAARRGVRVELTVDGYGSHELPQDYIDELADAGVVLHVFDPQPRLFGWRFNVFRRMHRKIVVIDGQLAFVGGINYSADHLLDFGDEAKQDYAVAVEGPIVEQIHRFALAQLPRDKEDKGFRRWFARRDGREARGDGAVLPKAGDAQAMFVVRDNRFHRTDIERHYRAAIRLARHRIVIANAYFFPGYRMLRDLRRAARRGVEVHLILQGQPDMPIVKTAAELLHADLLKAGVKVHEYCDRPLHGKVALVDDEWSTVGSSNLDPLSLSLNLEANVMIRDREFTQQLMDHLSELMRDSCKQVTLESVDESRPWSKLRSFFVYHACRLYPRWGALLPDHQPRVMTIASGPPGSAT